MLLSVLIYQVGSASAEVYLRDRSNDLVGRLEYHTALPGESLVEIARDFSIGYNTVVECNPGLNPFVPGAGVHVLINTALLLPYTQPDEGLVVNLSDYRLYHFSSEGDDRFVSVFPIGIGDDDWDTPLGSYNVAEKIVLPSWTPPPSIRKEDPSLPRSMLPGPNNPLGSHALRLSRRSILIHGTHRPYSVGRKASHGCLHLYPEDIPLLFKTVTKGTKVVVVRQPVKAGMSRGRIFLQVHRDEDFRGDYAAEAKRVLENRDHLAINHKKVMTAVETKNGIPMDVTED